MTIVAAVDRSERAVAVIEQANELADRYDVELHVVHVGDPTVDAREAFTDVSEEALRTRTGRFSETVLEQAQDEAAKVAVEAAERANGLESYEAAGLVGDAAEVIRNYASEHDAEYIVVSGRKRRPLGQALFGSVTQSLLLNADCPVVAVPHTDS
ncbi:universal stress protein [Natronolimnohabitans sp. A-GB9]|uniref:universal stress protein n=1 Tax=Natronolimnohabitans sp. A-GB9 TaxID=3069757 RepID=UPI0027B499FD|nr:universal stress protein [Natronolimnohabitans sp. A-GB9]MDQ2049947.1 universal stress protein [Natronolimnohabitans sp. A-GB9]